MAASTAGCVLCRTRLAHIQALYTDGVLDQVLGGLTSVVAADVVVEALGRLRGIVVVRGLAPIAIGGDGNGLDIDKGGTIVKDRQLWMRAVMRRMG